MKIRIKGKALYSSLGSAWMAVVLAACGGGVVAVAAIVTPLGGSWSESANEKIVFTVDSDYFSAERPMTATLQSASRVCGETDGAAGAGVELEGTLKDGELSLHVQGAADCLKGEFVDLARLRVPATHNVPEIVYENGRVDIGLEVGLWVSEDGKIKLKFTTPNSVTNDNPADLKGCDVSGATQVAFDGILQGLDSTTRANPFASELVRTDNSLQLYGRLEFVHGSEMQLDTLSGDTVVLERQVDTATTCNSQI